MRIKILLGILYFFIIISSSICSSSGVSPASYEIDFKPNLKQDFKFNFIFGDEANAEFYVSGDLTEYVNLNKKSLDRTGSVTASLNLPFEVETPGTHRIRIGAKQLPLEQEGISIVSDVGGIIKVKVPYPGKYAELDFQVTNANAGEQIELEIIVYSKGKEDIYATPEIKIFNSDGEIETIKLKTKFIKSTKNEKFLKTLSTLNYKPGDYNISAVVDYRGEKPATAHRIFRLGELKVGIYNWTKEFEKNKINRLEINIESFWNDLVEDLHAEVNIVNYDIGFSTPSIQIDSWKKDILTGFFDTSSIEEDEFRANITLYYKGKITTKIVDLHFKEESNYLYYGVIISLVLIVVVLILVILKRKTFKLFLTKILKRTKNEK